jgi:excisionase family DNA binding protein
MSGAEAWAKEVASMIVEEVKKGITPKDLYTMDEAAQFLACSREQVRNFMTSGRLIAVNIDSRPRFRLRDMEKFIEAAKT